MSLSDKMYVIAQDLLLKQLRKELTQFRNQKFGAGKCFFIRISDKDIYTKYVEENRQKARAHQKNWIEEYPYDAFRSCFFSAVNGVFTGNPYFVFFHENCFNFDRAINIPHPSEIREISSGTDASTSERSENWYGMTVYPYGK